MTEIVWSEVVCGIFGAGWAAASPYTTLYAPVLPQNSSLGLSPLLGLPKWPLGGAAVSASKACTALARGELKVEQPLLAPE